MAERFSEHAAVGAKTAVMRRRNNGMSGSSPWDPAEQALVQLLVFTIQGQSCAVALSRVIRVLRAVEITPLPKAPESVLGLINVRGEVTPVLSLRKQFRFPERPLELDDRLILAQMRRRAVALLADAIVGVVARPEAEILPPDSIVPGLPHLRGVLKLSDEIVFIHDLDKFLSLEEEAQLDDVLHAQL